MGNKNATEERKGLRITKIAPDSPASVTDLHAYVDFIVNVHNADSSFKIETDFYKHIIDNESKTVVLVLYNILTKKHRYIELTPSRNWPNADFLTGFKLRYESINAAEQNMFRVSKVIEPSLAGEIQPLFDFFIAVAEFEYKNVEDLKQKLNLYQKCELVLYNLEDNEVRTVQVNYNRKKGLGFEITQGYLHDLCYLYGLRIIEQMKKKGIENADIAAVDHGSLRFNEVEVDKFNADDEELIREEKNSNQLSELEHSQNYVNAKQFKDSIVCEQGNIHQPIIDETQHNTQYNEANKDEDNIKAHVTEENTQEQTTLLEEGKLMLDYKKDDSLIKQDSAIRVIDFSQTEEHMNLQYNQEHKPIYSGFINHTDVSENDNKNNDTNRTDQSL